MGKKTILVTGCSHGGLGEALALALHQSGWRVFATARNPAKMSSLKAAGIETLALDVLSQESISECIEAVAKLTGGSLDGLLNNAGGGLSMPIADVSIEEGKKLFDLNVWSVVAVTQAFLPMLLEAGSGAVIANNTSIAATTGLPFQGAYNASKAATMMISEAMRLELSAFNIKVIDLRTGVVKSNFFSNQENAMSTKLPANSIYQVARKAVEEVLIGVWDGKPASDNGQPANIWANKVVSDLNKKNPPSVIWRGTNTTLVWLSSFLPHKFLDSKKKQMVHLDEVEKAVREQKQAKS
jgi:1-acylglycerone phosphate reductase